jgi:hypothetical protein
LMQGRSLSITTLLDLLLHQKLHYHFGGVGNRRAGAKDSRNACLIQEVVVLRGDDTLLGGGRSSRFNGTTLRGEECNNAKKKCNSHTLTTKRMAIE